MGCGDAVREVNAKVPGCVTKLTKGGILGETFRVWKKKQRDLKAGIRMGKVFRYTKTLHFKGTRV
jgi:hypothetical protein